MLWRCRWLGPHIIGMNRRRSWLTFHDENGRHIRVVFENVDGRKRPPEPQSALESLRHADLGGARGEEAVSERIPQAFILLVDWAAAHGAKSIKDIDGCWERALSDRWWVAFNGHGESVKCSRGAPVPGYHAYLEFNGWPAGLLSPAGGTMVHSGDATEDALIGELRAALAALEAT